MKNDENKTFFRKRIPNIWMVLVVLGFLHVVIILLVIMPASIPSLRNQFFDTTLDSALNRDKLDLKGLERLEVSSMPTFPGDAKLSLSRFSNGSVLFDGDYSHLSYYLMKVLLSKHYEEGKRLRFGVFGGSISAGIYLAANESTYFDHVLRWFNSSLAPLGIDITAVDGSMSATGSFYFSLCSNEHLNVSDIDILFIEFDMNDALQSVYMPVYRERGRPLEELIRAIWRVNPMVQLILVNFPHISTLFNGDSKVVNCSWIDDQEFLQIAKRYDIPSIGWKHIFCQNGQQVTDLEILDISKRSIFLQADNIHPNWIVHFHMAEFLVAHLRHAVEGLKMEIISGDAKVMESEVVKRGARIKTKTTNAVLLSNTHPLFQTTWIDGVDCFTNVENNSLISTSRRLEEAIRDYSFTKPERYPVNQKRGVYRSVYEFKKPGTKAAFHFDRLRLSEIQLTTCGSKSAIPHIAMAYKMCTNCSRGGILAGDVSFKFSDGSIKHFGFHHDLNMPPYGVTAVEFLRLVPSEVTTNDFCKYNNTELRDLTSIDFRLEKMNEKYFLLLYSIIIAYDCCDARAPSRVVT